MRQNNQTQAHRIPGDREHGRSSFIHLAILASGKIGALAPYTLIPLWITLSILTYNIWQHDKFVICTLAVLSFGTDWLILGLLPVKHRSWGPVMPSLLGLLLVRVFFRLLGGILLAVSWSLILTILIDVALSVITVYATWVEPFNISVTRKHLHVPTAILPRELRLLHISDIHYEGDSPREAQLLKIVETESPDVIVLTGDYLNLSSVFDPLAHTGAKKLLSQLKAPMGVYAVSGSPAVDHMDIVPEIFEGLSIRWLQDEACCLPLSGANLCFVGIVNTYNEQRDINALKQIIQECPKHSYALLLYHTPDLMPNATEMGVNLYLCGHTHGGQISLPVYGAVVTSSKWGKRYERGLYCEEKTFLYVSRGLGMEGMGAPRARFFARPEVIMWTFVPDQTLTDGASIV